MVQPVVRIKCGMGCAWGNSGATGTQKLQEQNVIDDSGTNKMFVSSQPEGDSTEKVYETFSTQALEEKPLNTQSTKKVRKKEKLYRHRW